MIFLMTNLQYNMTETNYLMILALRRYDTYLIIG